VKFDRRKREAQLKIHIVPLGSLFRASDEKFRRNTLAIIAARRFKNRLPMKEALRPRAFSEIDRTGSRRHHRRVPSESLAEPRSCSDLVGSRSEEVFYDQAHEEKDRGSLSHRRAGQGDNVEQVEPDCQNHRLDDGEEYISTAAALLCVPCEEPIAS